MEVRKLTCPSCGAQVDIPADLSRAHCVYCGSMLVVERVDEAERQAIETHLQLGRTAFEAQNCQEALEHFNKVLEVDPNNVDAWVGKARASAALSTAADDRLDEALRYIDKALELDPENTAARQATQVIKLTHSIWLNNLADNEWELSIKIAERYLLPRSVMDATVGVDPTRKRLARTESAPHVQKALEYLRRAFSLNPNNAKILENIAWVLSHEPGGREYGDPALYEKAAKFVERRKSIRGELITLRDELSELEQQKQRGGFGLLDRRRGQYSRIKERIAQLESVVEAAAALGIDTKV